LDRTVIEGRRDFAALLADRKGQLEKPHYAGQVAAIVAALAGAFRRGNKVLWFGNGGSAADAQHVAAELTGRYLIERAPLPAIALTDNTAALSAIANDYGYDQVFARQVEALGRPGDLPRIVLGRLPQREVLAGCGLRDAGPGAMPTVKNGDVLGDRDLMCCAVQRLAVRVLGAAVGGAQFPPG